jgi:hypothetical protein
MLAALLALQSDLSTLYNTVGPSGYSEPGFVNLLRSPGIDSQPGGSERQRHLTYRPGTIGYISYQVVSLESIPELLKGTQE